MASLGLIGRKCGMTRIFTEAGVSIPVTVVSVNANYVTQLKTASTDGYLAVQITTDEKRASRITKPMAGHFGKAGVQAGKGLWEFRLEGVDTSNHDLNLGAALDVSLFEAGQKVDVTGTSKGKGFAGAVKRHNFKMQDATHGNSLSHRALGSTGQCQFPGRVFRGKKMAGHMGNVRSTTQNLEIVRVDQKRGFLLIKGAVPGAKQGYVRIQPAVKLREVIRGA